MYSKEDCAIIIIFLFVIIYCHSRPVDTISVTRFDTLAVRHTQ